MTHQNDTLTPVTSTYRWLAAFCIFMVLIGPASAEETPPWPQFRGPNSQGVARDAASYPDRLNPARNLLWKTPAPGGMSSPIVAGDRVFVTGIDDKQRLQTLAIDRSTGRLLWRKEAPAEKIEKVYHANSPAASSPASDGQRVFAYFGSYGLICYDFEGRELWKKPIPSMPRGFGSATSPVIVGDKLLLNGQGKDSHLAAFRVSDGELQWKVDKPTYPSDYPAPVVWKRDGVDEVILPGAGGVAAYDLRDGSRHWWLGGLSVQAVPIAVIGDGTIFVTSYLPGGDIDHRLELPEFDDMLKKFDKDADGKLAAAEVPRDFVIYHRGGDGGVGDMTVHNIFGRFDTNGDRKIERVEWKAIITAFDNTVLAIRPKGNGQIDKSSVLWEQKKAIPEVPSPLLYQGHLYLVKNGGLVACYEAKSGKLLYYDRLGAGGLYYASPVAADGKVYMSSLKGVVSVVKAGDSLEVLSRTNLGEEIAGTPALAGGTVYVRTRDHVWAFGAR